VNVDETIVFPVERRPIFHAFSDNHDLPGATIPIYSLHEILVEKLRAFSGQRRFAIARDIFDIYRISTRVDPHPSLEMLETKCRAKGLSTVKIDLAALKSRKEEYKQNWEKNLKYLVPPVIWVRFEDAWVRSIQLLGLALRHVES
jgi:predicted nucleotidyltransferase component of viral defense system